MTFYKSLFGALCFAFFLAGISTGAPFAFLAALVSGAFYRTADKRQWSDPGRDPEC